jgi:hypothetical protein
MTLAQLEAAFSTEGLNKSNCVVDRTKLAWFNGQHLRLHVAASPVQLPQLVQWMWGGAVAPTGSRDCLPFAEAAVTALPSIAASVAQALETGLAGGLSSLAQRPTEGAVLPAGLPLLAAKGELAPEQLVHAGSTWCVRWGVLHAALLLHHERVGMYPDYGALCWPLFAPPRASNGEVAQLMDSNSSTKSCALLVALHAAWSTLPAEAWLEAGVPLVMQTLKKDCQEEKAKQRELMKPVRIVLTATDRGVGMSDLLMFMGRKEVLGRLSRGLPG